jgi:hypothetical protein
MLSADDVAQHLDGLVHLDTQRAPTGIDLTLGAVYRTTGPGSLDFGGGEFDEAACEKLAPVRQNPDDDYGWWLLDGGTYVVTFNESLRLADGQRAVLRPLERTVLAGAHHPAMRLTGDRDPMRTLLTVPSVGCRLKENARLTRIEVQERAKTGRSR